MPVHSSFEKLQILKFRKKKKVKKLWTFILKHSLIFLESSFGSTHCEQIYN